MSPTIVSSPFVPPTDTANVQGPVHPPSASYQFGIVFWPILFGVLLIALIWRLCTWKAKSKTAFGPFSTPNPPASDVTRTAHIRGAPLVSRLSAAPRASTINLPPPAYIHPPRYDDNRPTGEIAAS